MKSQEFELCKSVTMNSRYRHPISARHSLLQCWLLLPLSKISTLHVLIIKTRPVVTVHSTM